MVVLPLSSPSIASKKKFCAPEVQSRPTISTVLTVLPSTLPTVVARPPWS